MGLKETFLNAVETTFTVFSDAVKSADYVDSVDDGFDEDPVVTTTPNVRIILDSFTKEDIETLPFSDKIQSTDIKGLIPGVDLENASIKTSNVFNIEIEGSYTLVEFTTDAYRALYTCLLRDS